MSDIFQINYLVFFFSPQALRCVLPCSWLKWGASHAASEPGPGQGWWQPACDPQGSLLLWLQLAVTKKTKNKKKQLNEHTSICSSTAKS